MLRHLKHSITDSCNASDVAVSISHTPLVVITPPVSVVQFSCRMLEMKRGMTNAVSTLHTHRVTRFRELRNRTLRETLSCTYYLLPSTQIQLTSMF
jgi:hypothetical protein